MPKRKATPATLPADTRNVCARGEEWQAEKLTGNRGQKGNLPGGAPRWTYEVVWKGSYKNTYEPAGCLVGWEKEMKAIDDRYSVQALLPRVSPAAEALKVREAAAKAKAAELEKKKARLQRLKARKARMGNDDSEAELSEADDEVEEDEESLSEAALAEALVALEAQLTMLAGGQVFAQAAAAAAAGQELGGAQLASDGIPQGHARLHKKEGRSRVWKAFDRATNRCTLPHPTELGRRCHAGPGGGTGTSGHIRHLEQFHHDEWLHIKIHGDRKTSSQIITDALAAKTDESMPALGDTDKNELDRLVARWVAKCGRPQAIAEDKELRELLARILQLCKARYRYTLPAHQGTRPCGLPAPLDDWLV